MALGVLSAAGLLLLFNYTPNAATVSLLIGLLPILVWTPRHWFQLDAHRASHALLRHRLWRPHDCRRGYPAR